jgi:hypothetical protein
MHSNAAMKELMTMKKLDVARLKQAALGKA